MGPIEWTADHLVKVMIRQSLGKLLGLGLTQGIERNIQLALNASCRIPVGLAMPAQPEFYCLAHLSLL